MKPTSTIDVQPALNYIRENFPALLEDCRDYLRVRSDSKANVGIQEGAEATLSFLRRAGCVDARLVPTTGFPVVFGTLPSKQPDAPTLIVHWWYDTAALIPGGGQEWKFPPFGASIVDAKEADLPAEWGKVLVNRAATNQKGPGIAALLGLEALTRACGDVPVNLILVVEGEEEVGSPHLHEFTTEYDSVLRQAQGIYVPYARQGYLGGNSMLISLGYKGDVLIELECQGATTDGRDLWCGHSSLVESPLWRLVHALSTMVDIDGNVLIDGFYEHYRGPTPEEEAELRRGLKLFSEEQARRILNVSKFRKNKPLEELMLDYVWGPQFNLNGIVSGWTGPSVEWTMPMRALAKCDIRLSPNMNKDDILAKLRVHLDHRGFEDVIVRPLAGYNWTKWSRKDLVIEAGARAAERLGIPYDISPATGSCNPLLYLGLPCLYTGPGHGGRWHCQDEYITVDGLRGIMEYTVTMLDEMRRLYVKPSDPR